MILDDQRLDFVNRLQKTWNAILFGTLLYKSDTANSDDGVVELADSVQSLQWNEATMVWRQEKTFRFL